jgi:signal transduction histidine kinase
LWSGLERTSNFVSNANCLQKAACSDNEGCGAFAQWDKFAREKRQGTLRVTDARGWVISRSFDGPGSTPLGVLCLHRVSSSERRHTDASLRSERAHADETADSHASAIDDAAEADIALARRRADALLATARARSDGHPVSAESARVLDEERGSEDEAVRHERAAADESRRHERAERMEMLSVDRATTDHDLLGERERSDQSVAARDEFLGIVTHDLRSMLNGMLGFAALIEDDLRDNASAQACVHYAQRIRRSGARMNGLIGDLLDVASIDAGRLAVNRVVGDPAAVVREAVETFQPQAAASGISVVADIVPPPVLASFDAARILQVLANLLGNALKFTPAAGSIAVRVQRVRDEVCTTVTDTGVGIPADKLEAIFGRFLQVRRHDHRGTGLGLYISKCIIQGHGGRIWAESTVGRGSTFTFTLPVCGSS